jgi:hypothetical protein
VRVGRCQARIKKNSRDAVLFCMEKNKMAKDS